MNEIFRPATLMEYLNWYRAFYDKGGRPTHYYDYPWSRWSFLYAQKDFRLGGELGSAARQIIVGPHARWLSGGLGHNGLYLDDGTHTSLTVPVFSDQPFTLLPGYEELRRRDELHRGEWYQRSKKWQRERERAAQLGDLSARGPDNR